MTLLFRKEGFSNFLVFQNINDWRISGLISQAPIYIKNNWKKNDNEILLESHFIKKSDEFPKFILKIIKNESTKIIPSEDMKYLYEVIKNYENIVARQLALYKNLKTLSQIKNENFLKFLNNDFTPYKFQIKQASFAYNNKTSCNFSSPGAGKTIISSLMISKLFDEGVNNVIVIGPISASEAWSKHPRKVLKKEIFSKFYIDGKTNLSGEKFKNNLKIFNDEILNKNKLKIFFINFHKFNNDKMTNEILKIFKKHRFVVIIDEAHYLKNILTSKNKNIRLLTKRSEATLLLTGTPFPRSFSEGNFIPKLLWPDCEIDELDFTRKEVDEVKKILPKIYVRKDKNKVKTLKPLYKKEIIIEISSIEKYLLNKLNRINKNLLDSLSLENIDKAILIRLMQAASNPKALMNPINIAINEMWNDNKDIEDDENLPHKCDDDISKKIDEIIKSSEFNKMINNYNYFNDPRYIKVKSLIEKHINERIVIWNVFKGSSKNICLFLKYHFKNKKIFLINGDIVGEEREIILNLFKVKKNSILIASPATIAESISLHEEVNIAIYFFRNYVGSHWMQSLNRIHRLVSPGEKTKEKTAYIIKSKGNVKSIDQMISVNLDNKVETQEDILNI